MRQKEKPLAWLGSALENLRVFPGMARQHGGHQLRKLQQGEQADDGKSMSAAGPVAIEIRVHTGAELRVCVVTKFEEAIYVLHVRRRGT